MPAKLLAPTLDIVFKLVLLRNPVLLRDMIESVVKLPGPIASIDILSSEIPKDFPADKSIALDIRVLLDNGHQIDLERQSTIPPGTRGRFHVMELPKLHLATADRQARLSRTIDSRTRSRDCLKLREIDNSRCSGYVVASPLRRIRFMRLSTLACCAALVFVTIPGFLACNDAGTQESQSGTVSLPLTATSANGTTYRLTNATFSVTGGTLTSAMSLSSAADPTVTSVSSELSTGSYSMAIQPGWQMVRVDAAGATTVVNAILVSASTQTFTIAEQTVTAVSYLFNVNGIIVATGTGTVQVNVGVNEVGPGAYGNGMINGYASTVVSANSTISPANFSTITSNGPFCIAGTLGASYVDYAAVWLSLNEVPAGTMGSLALGNRTASYNISGIVNSGQLARINLVDADGNRWCANVPVGAGSLATSAFATNCWTTGGAAYAGQAVTAFEVVAVGMTTPQSYNFCLNSLAFN